MGKIARWLLVLLLLSRMAWEGAAAPANDDFTNAILVTNLNLTLSGSNTGASKEAGEPSHAGNAGGASVWWTWVAPASGPVKIFTQGSALGGGGGMDTLLAVYTGASAASLSLVTSNDDQQTDPFITDTWSYASFNAVGGTAYHIAVDGKADPVAETGSVQLHIFQDNNLFANRLALSGVGLRATNWNIGATSEAGELSYRTDDGLTNFPGKSIWWTWTSPTNRAVIISTYGSDFDTVLTVYTSSSTNPSLATLVQQRSNNDDTNEVVFGGSSFVTFTPGSGTTYYLNVDGADPDLIEFYNAGQARLTLTWDNDTFSTGRIPLSGTNLQARGTNLRASRQAGEPTHNPDGSDPGGASVWWTWTAPFSGLVTINTDGSDFDTVLAVYTNTSTTFGTFRQIAANDDEPGLPYSQVRFLTSAGVTYQIAVDGYDGASGNVDLNLTLTPANVPPTLAAIADRTVNEDATAQVITLTGISPGGSDETNQIVTITAFSTDTGYILDPVVNYTNGASTAALTLTLATNASDAAVLVTVVVQDNGGTAGGGADMVTTNFLVTINPVNDAPTLTPIASLTLLEDAEEVEITMTGITAGGDEFQEVTITATSSSTALLPHPAILYNSLDEEGTLTFTPNTNAFGTATVTIIVRDDGGTALGGRDGFTNTFTVTVLPVNDAPAINTLTNITVNEDSGQRTVSMAGIGSGAANEPQVLTIDVSSSDTGLLTVQTITYNSPAATGTLRFTPVTNTFGAATVTVVLSDNGGTDNGGVAAVTNTFLFTVLPVNDRPTLTALSSRTILEDAGLQVTNLLNISIGAPNETNQALIITALSSNPSLIPNPLITYTNGQSTGTASFASLTNANGTATISVIVSDDGGTANGGFAAVTNTFSVTVTAVNDPPTIDPLANLALNETTWGQTLAIGIANITDGPPDEASQSVNTRSVSSSNTALIPAPTITHANGGVTASVSIRPATNMFGTATINVIFTDNGGTANGGVNSSTNTFRVTVLPSPAVGSLVVTQAGPNAVVSWPATVSGWVLESTTNFTAWLTVSNSQFNSGGRVTVTNLVDPAAGKTFYRLRRP